MVQPSSTPKVIIDDLTSQVNPIRGGVKHKWLVEHREVILSYCAKNGKAATLKKFQLKDTTLYDLVHLNLTNNNNRCPRCGSALLMDSDYELACFACGYRPPDTGHPVDEDKTSELRQSPSQRDLHRYRILLSRLKKNEDRIAELEKWKDTSKIMFERTWEARNEESRKVKELTEAFYGFTTNVSEYLADGMKRVFKLILGKGMHVERYLPPPLEKTNLNIDHLILTGRKEQIRRKERKAPDNPLLETVVRLEKRD